MKKLVKHEITPKGIWSLRLALFTAQLLAITVLLHRFAGLATPYATNLVVVSLLAAAFSFLLAVLAFTDIWSRGIGGTGNAVAGMLLALTIFAVPLYNLPGLMTLPAINDITTDLLSPPQFRKITALRGPGANSTHYPGTQFISKQARAYPDIGTLMLERSHRDSYELVHGVIDDLGWEIVNERQPGKRSRTGYIEAVDQSMIMGFRDDVVIRIKGNRRSSRIDMRSSSRYGRHDLGANAKRIRELFQVVKTRIARAEAKRIDAIERKRIARQKRSEKKRKARERKKLERQQQRENAPVMLPKANFDEVGVRANEEGALPEGEGRQGSDGPVAAGEPNGFDLFAPQQPQKVKKRRKQKLRRSKRKRKKRNWVPFENY